MIIVLPKNAFLKIVVKKLGKLTPVVAEIEGLGSGSKESTPTIPKHDLSVSSCLYILSYPGGCVLLRLVMCIGYAEEHTLVKS